MKNLSPVLADPEFRTRVKQRFLSGPEVPEILDLTEPRRSPWPRIAAAAALLATVVLVWRASTPSSWQLTEIAADGTVWVDGEASDLAELDTNTLRNGTRLRLDQTAELFLVGENDVLMHLRPGTEIELPAREGWPWEDRWRARIDDGEVFITTGPRFVGNWLSISTPESEVEITGTTLAIVRHLKTTCIGVYEGRVMTTCDNSLPEEVQSGFQRLHYPDRPATREQLNQNQIDRLRVVHDRGLDLWTE